MAKLINPLDGFQSHSVHYTVLAANSTEALRDFTDGAAAIQSQALAAIDNCGKLGGRVKSQKNEDVFLVLDTRRFSQFTISDLSFKTLYAGTFSEPGGTNSPHNMCQDLKFTLIDSAGISFANYLQYLLQSLQMKNIASAVFLLKVLFIGHNTDGSTTVIQNATIPFQLKTIEMDLNEVKGVYHVFATPLVGIDSYGSKNSHITQIGKATSYFSGVGVNTLGAIVSSFEKRLNEEKLEYFNKLKTPEEPVKGRPTQYMITIPPAWENFTFSSSSVGGAKEVNFKELLQAEVVKKQEANAATAATIRAKGSSQQATAALEAYISVDPEISILDILDMIFKQTIKVQELGNFSKNKSDGKNIKFYKHLISTTSDNDSVTTHIDVVEFVIPNVLLAAQNSALAGQSDDVYFKHEISGGKSRRVPKSFLEYDFIFSGKNVDIIHFDLKLAGLSNWISNGTAYGLKALESTAIEGQKQTDTVPVGNSAPPKIGGKDPIYMPIRTAEENNNFSNINVGSRDQAVIQEYTRNLSDWYSNGQGGISIKATIRGNPYLFTGVTLTTVMQHVSEVSFNKDGTASATNANVKSEYRKKFETEFLRLSPGIVNAAGGAFSVNPTLTAPGALGTPIYCRIKILGPNTDFFDNEQLNDQFARELFPDNFYQIRNIEHKFEGSKFTQELEMYAQSLYAPDTGGTAAKQEPKKI